MPGPRARPRPARRSAPVADPVRGGRRRRRAGQALIATDVATVRPAARLRGELRLPGDKSISHRALLLATLAAGESRIAGAGDGADVRSTAARDARARRDRRASRADADGRNVDYRVVSPGADGLTEPARRPRLRQLRDEPAAHRRAWSPGLPMTAVLDGDASLRRRPVARIIEPLRRMGAVLHGRRDDSLPPLTVVGHTPLQGDGLHDAGAVGAGEVGDPAGGVAGRGSDDGPGTRSRHATTRSACCEREACRSSGRRDDGAVAVTVEGGTAVQAIDQHVPADVSAAAFWLVAGAIHPDAELTLRDVGVNPTRRAVIDLLRAMGADIEERPVGVLGRWTDGRRRADRRPRSSARRSCAPSTSGRPTSPRRSTRSPSSASPRRRRSGTTTIRGAGELRHKESDRIAGIAAGLRALGADVEVDGDDLPIHGGAALRGGATDSLDDHRLAMTFAIAGLVASGRDDHRAAGLGRGLLSRLLRRSRRGASMTKRVVLIGHPVAHSLSGAMQQAAFDELGIDARYELWDAPPIELADAVGELRADDFLGANVTIPHKERVVPMVDRLTEEAAATGAVNTITREGKRLIGHNTDVAGFKVALDKLVGRQKMPKQAVVLGAGGGARAVVYGLIREGFQRVIVFNRHLHRAEGLVKHFGRSAAHMELRAMPWHESIIESEIAKTKVLDQRDVDRADLRREPGPGRGPPRRAARARPDLRARRGCCATPRRPARRRSTAS